MSDGLRVPCTRHDADGTVVDATALHVETDKGGFQLSDFRDLDGTPLDLPAGSSFVFELL